MFQSTVSLLALLALGGCSATEGSQGSASLSSASRPSVPGERKDIVATARSAGSFTTLVQALKAAGLVETLQGEGPFTVFAPTDAAFAALPEGTLEELLLPENRERLSSILTYHVVPGRLASTQVLEQGGAVTVQGQKLEFAMKDDSVRVDGASVVRTDIECTNGIVHVIDAVLLPSSTDVVATAASAGRFKTLLAAAKAAGLADFLAKEGPITVFAPTDAAFAALPEGTIEELLRPESKERLQTILKHHVVRGRVYASDVLASTKGLTTLAGTTLTVRKNEKGAAIGGAKIEATDVDASNGVVHVIGGVMLP